MASMRLMYFPVNAAWAFVFGDRPTSMGGQMMFPSREQAVSEARAMGLKVNKDGKVSTANRSVGRHSTRNRAGGGKRIRIAYDIVTPESAEEGEAAESGWIEEEGLPFMSAGEAARFLKNEGAHEPSSSRFHKGIWYIGQGDIDYERGAQESRSFFLDGFNEKEQRIIYDMVTGRR